jgi:hypothetical protein
MIPLINLIGLIPGAAKYVPIAKFLLAHGDKVADLAATSGKAVEAIEKTDPTIIPHLEAVTADLVKAAGASPPVAEGENVDPPRVVGKHIVAKALVAPGTLSADEKAWMDRASAGG